MLLALRSLWESTTVGEEEPDPDVVAVATPAREVGMSHDAGFIRRDYRHGWDEDRMPRTLQVSAAFALTGTFALQARVRQPAWKQELDEDMTAFLDLLT